MTVLGGLPPQSLERHVAIVATSDGGKTYAAKGEAELLLDAGARVFVIDPTGVWFGLRLSPDGKTPSRFEIPIFGGDHADVAIDGGCGAALARLVAEGRFSGILDVARLTVGERTRLFADFAETLAMANRAPLHLIIDEAHLFAPQGRVQDPTSGRMVHAANHLVAAGRALGLRIMLLTQRPAKLHKDSLTQVQTLVAMLNVSPQDRKAVKDWIAESADPARAAEILTSLPSMPVGEGWVWAPRLEVLERVKFRPITTFDSSAAPELLATRGAVTRLDAIDLEALRSALAAEPAEGLSPGRKLAKRMGAPVFTQRDVELAEARGYQAGMQDGRGVERELLFRRLEAIAAELRGDGESAKTDMASQDATAANPPAKSYVAAGTPAPPDRPKKASAPQRAREGTSAAAAKLLEVLESRSFDVLRWDEAALLAILSPAAGNTRMAINELRAAGVVEESAAGVHARRTVERDLDPEHIVNAWAAKLDGAAGRMLRAIFARPRTYEQACADVATSPIGGYARRAFKSLRSRGLIERDSHLQWRAASVLRSLKEARIA